MVDKNKIKDKFTKYLQQLSYNPVKVQKPENFKTIIKKLIRNRKCIYTN